MNRIIHREAPAQEAEPASKRRRRWVLAALAFLLLALLIVLAGSCVSSVVRMRASGDAGTLIVQQGEQDDDAIQSLIDERAEKSRITVSVSAQPRLAADGSLRINFVVEPPNNGFAERIEIEQDGRLVYQSGIVEPGRQIEWCDADGACIGPATATVYAVGDGADCGNPVSVEVEIVSAEQAGETNG